MSRVAFLRVPVDLLNFQEIGARARMRRPAAGRGCIVRKATRLLDDPAAYNAMAPVHNPYGDGLAAKRIARIVGNGYDPGNSH